MGQRALVLKAPYGAAFMQQLDGSLWLVYNNDAKGTSDVDILNWLRDTAVAHSGYVERNIVAEHRAESRPIVLEPSAEPGIAEKVLSTLTQPIKVETPGARVHDFGGQYRIGSTCKVCGTKATGLEVQACPGVMISPVPAPKGPTVNEILAPKSSQPSIVPVTPPATVPPPSAPASEVPLHSAAPIPGAPFPPPPGTPLAPPMNLKAPVPRVERNPNAPVPPPIPPLEKAAPPLGAPFPPPNSPAEGTRQTAPVNPPNGSSSNSEQG